MNDIHSTYDYTKCEITIKYKINISDIIYPSKNY